MKMLLHMCCGPCASGALPFWQRKGVTPEGFFFNPNVHPFLEYRRRLEGAKEVAAAMGIELVVDAGYDPEAWFSEVSGYEGSRCRQCIAMRLDRTAKEAAARGHDAFSTTLAISPWQDHEAIRAGGLSAAAAHGVEFVYADLREEYPESRRLSRGLGIYRQKYCGCLVSEWERYREAGSDARTSRGEGGGERAGS